MAGISPSHWSPDYWKTTSRFEFGLFLVAKFASDCSSCLSFPFWLSLLSLLLEVSFLVYLWALVLYRFWFVTIFCFISSWTSLMFLFLRYFFIMNFHKTYSIINNPIIISRIQNILFSSHTSPYFLSLHAEQVLALEHTRQSFWHV